MAVHACPIADARGFFTSVHDFCFCLISSNHWNLLVFKVWHRHVHVLKHFMCIYTDTHRHTHSHTNDYELLHASQTHPWVTRVVCRLLREWGLLGITAINSSSPPQVVDIVRSNVKAVLQRIWRSSDVDNLRLYRIFSRVFNRLLWSHGQGLWNCFSPSTG